jgi:hypothetical protein
MARYIFNLTDVKINQFCVRAVTQTVYCNFMYVKFQKQDISVQSSKLLLVLASAVILEFGPRREI